MSRLANFLLSALWLGALTVGCAPQATPAPTLEPTPAETATPAPPTAIPLPTFTPIPSPLAGGLFVDAAQDLGPVSPYVYGTNYGPWIALPAAGIEDAKKAGMTLIRFPGGAWGDQNVLKDYQIDQFLGFCQMLGAMPSISVNLRSGSPEQAAALVKMVNLDKKYRVKYWSIGNEPTLYTNEGKGTYDTPQYNEDWRKFALAMLAVDPSIILIGPELHQYSADPAKTPKDSAGRDWMTEFLKANGDLVGVISFHRYPFPRNMTDSPSVADLRQNTAEWTEMLRNLHALIRETTGRDLPVAITEFNTHYNKAIQGEATPDSHYNAIWLADLLGRFIREDVLIANHWMLTSSGGQGGWGLIGRGELRPSYYTYQLYQMFGTQRVFSSSDVADVNLYAAKTESGALTVMLVNLNDEVQTVPLTLNGITAPATAQVWLLDPTHNAEAVPDLALTQTSAVELPGQSVTLLVIK